MKKIQWGELINDFLVLLILGGLIGTGLLMFGELALVIWRAL
jgi:hypothetical protein